MPKAPWLLWSERAQFWEYVIIWRAFRTVCESWIGWQESSPRNQFITATRRPRQCLYKSIDFKLVKIGQPYTKDGHHKFLTHCKFFNADRRYAGGCWSLYRERVGSLVHLSCKILEPKLRVSINYHYLKRQALKNINSSLMCLKA